MKSKKNYQLSAIEYIKGMRRHFIYYYKKFLLRKLTDPDEARNYEVGLQRWRDGEFDLKKQEKMEENGGESKG